MYIYGEISRYTGRGKIKGKAQLIDTFLGFLDNHMDHKNERRKSKVSSCFKFYTTRTGKSHTVCAPRAQCSKGWTVFAPLCPLNIPAQFYPLQSDIWTPLSPSLLSFLLGSSPSFVLAGQISLGLQYCKVIRLQLIKINEKKVYK